MTHDLTGETVELLQTLIRNRCVNDGSATSGHETRNADVLQSLVEGPGVDIERCDPSGTATSSRSTRTAGARTRSAAR